MTLPLIRSRKKPRFRLPWLAMTLGLGTAVFGVHGIGSMTATPGEQVQIIVRGEHPWNISQKTVDAVMSEPIMTMKPLQIIVTPERLSHEQLTGREDFGANVILSTVIENVATPGDTKYRYTGAGVYPRKGPSSGAWKPGYQIEKAYLTNVALGHGPAAVVAAAQRAAAVVDETPIQSPIFWLTGTTIGLGATALALGYSLSRRRRREQIHQRLSAAQHTLAAVVLELEALEVTYRTTPETQRTSGFTQTWISLHDDSLALARTEDAVAAAVHDRSTASSPATAAMVDTFRAGADGLAGKAEALLGAGSVLGKLDGGQRVLDRLAAPMTLAARELLARLSQATPNTVSKRSVRTFQKAFHGILEVLGETNASLGDWKTAEAKLQRSAAAVTRSLQSNDPARSGTTARSGSAAEPGARSDFGSRSGFGSSIEADNHRSLRTGLGLLDTGSESTLAALAAANAAGRERFGLLPGESPDEGRGRLRRPDSYTDASPSPTAIRARSNSRFLGWAAAGAAIVIFSLPLSSASVSATSQAPERGHTGSIPLRSLVVDGDLEGIKESGLTMVRNQKFPQEVDITVAVRSASDYLHLRPGQTPDTYGLITRQDPQVLTAAMWRLKNEFPHLLNPKTGELLDDQAIIPVWSLGNGTFTAPTLLSGAIALGDYESFGMEGWHLGYLYVSDSGEIQIAVNADNLARGIQNNNINKPQINDTLLVGLLALSIAVALLTLLQIITYGGAISMKLGRFGRSASTLDAAHNELDALTLGLDDTRLNAVAMLGQGSAATRAESDQRIFERSLALAWRMADELAAYSLSQRLNAEYVVKVMRLSALVSALAIRDGDIQRRTKALLEARHTNGPRQRPRK